MTCHKPISWLLEEVAYHEPIVPFIFGWVSGLIAGHLFWVNPVPGAIDGGEGALATLEAKEGT